MKNYKYYGFLIAFLLIMLQNVTAQTPDLSKMTKEEREGYIQQQALSKMTKAQQEEYIKQLSLKKIADINSAVGQAKANNDQVLKKIQSYRTDYTKSLPVNKPGISVSNIPASTQAYVINLAQNLLALAQQKLTDVVVKAQLDKMLKDTSINVPGTAMLMLANGMSKYEGEYLICKDIIKHPSNAWSINDLAILYRNDVKYIESIAAFQYALKLLNDSSIVIKTNLAWACSYYGDFRAAKKYFNEVLRIDPYFSSAMEGLAIIAYNEGDLGALFDCLMKEVTGLGGGDDGGSGPSQEFSGLCGGVMDQNALATAGTDIDPTTDHTFDNVADDSPDQDPPTADNDEVKVPSMKFIFVNDAMDLTQFFGKLGSAIKTIQDELQKCTDEPRQKMSTLPILKPIPYLDEHGDKVIPANYEKYVNLFHEVSDLFMRKVYWSAKKYEKEISDFLRSVSSEKYDMAREWAAGGCGDCEDEKCNAFLCIWVPRAHGVKNAQIEAAGRIWNKYFDQVLESCNSYIRNSSPFIKRVHTQQWNEYVNLLRQYNVRKAYLIMYGAWVEALVGVGDDPTMRICYHPCSVELRLMSDASPDPYSKKLKPLKTFAGPCYTTPTNRSLGPLNIIDNCEKTKVSLKAEPFKLSFEKDYNRKFKEGDEFKLGIGVEFEKKVLSSGVTAGVEAVWKFNNNHDLIAKGFDASFEAVAKVGPAQIGNTVNPLNSSVSASVEVMTQCGQNAPTNYQTTYHIEKK
jgi:tetratricopeptide (TPR) repeat protein